MKIFHEIINSFVHLHIDPEGFQTADPPRELWFTSNIHYWETGFNSNFLFPIEPSKNNRFMPLTVEFHPEGRNDIEFKIYDRTYHRYCEPLIFEKDGALYNGAENLLVRNSFNTFNVKYCW